MTITATLADGRPRRYNGCRIERTALDGAEIYDNDGRLIAIVAPGMFVDIFLDGVLIVVDDDHADSVSADHADSACAPFPRPSKDH